MRKLFGRLLRDQTLAFRFSVLLAVTLIVFDLLRRGLDFAIMQLLGVDRIGQTLTGFALSALIAIGLAIPLALFVSRRLTERLTKLTDAAAVPVQGDELPGPFDASGEDEISAIAAAMNSLRARFEDRTKEFALKDIRRREWIAQVSHDLRTPLTAQAASLDRADQILQQANRPREHGKLRELIAVAKLDGDRVHTLADDLLEIARLDAGDHLVREPVPPGELVRQAVRSLEPLANQRGIQLEVQVTSRLPVLNADGRRLMRAIENLVRNAIQHARSRVEVLAMLTDERVHFEVRDDGPGLPKQPDFLAYLRRRSSEVRLAELAKRGSRPDSAGLGLVVAQRVAEVHQGKIDAYNLSQGGAAFWMEIPVGEESPTVG